MKNFNSVAIIGAGAAGTSFLYHLIYALKNSNSKKTQITIFDDQGCSGAGNIYIQDSDTALLNTPAHLMSPIHEREGDFIRWAIKYKNVQDENKDLYLPRCMFGEYLNYIFNELKTVVKNTAIGLEEINSRVINIEKNDKYTVTTSENRAMRFDYIVLCTGNEKFFDHYNLTGHSRYINDPFPLNSHSNIIPEGSRIAVIGSGLSAIDIAIALYNEKHLKSNSVVHMYSPSGQLPPVRASLLKYTSKILTKENIIKKGNNLTLKYLLKLLRDELRLSGEYATWKRIFFSYTHEDIQLRLENEILLAENKEIVWQSIFRATNLIVEWSWHFLSDVDKKLFMEKYHRIWNLKRTSFPLVNAKKIHSMLLAGFLKVKKGLQHIEFINNNFFVSDGFASPKIKYDWVINGTGPSRKVQNNNYLLMRLIDNGNITSHPYGGVKIDFDTSAAINKFNMPDFQFRVIGNLTCGCYYYTSSLEMISKRAKIVAQQLSTLMTLE